MSGGYDFSHLFPANTLAFSPGTTSESTIFRSKEPCVASSATEATSEAFIIDTLQWSGDSTYLLVHSKEAKMAWVYGVAQEGEAAHVGGMGVEGLSKVEWGKGNREVAYAVEALYIQSIVWGNQTHSERQAHRRW